MNYLISHIVSVIISPMNFDLRNLLNLQPITATTINGVMLSPEFITLIYTFMFLTLCFVTVIFLNRNSFSKAVRKAVMVAFFSSGLICAVQGDIVWTSWFITDAKFFAGLTTDEKLRSVEGDLYDFVLAARNVIHGDYMLFSSVDYLPERTEYLLLPLRRRELADYIIVVEDNESTYYEADRVFIRGSIRINHVMPVYVMAPNAYVLKRML